MDAEQVRRVLTAFADKQADLDLDRGHLLVQVHDDLISAEAVVREGGVVVSEGGLETTAERWLVTRIGRIPQLADRIVEYVPIEQHFVTPSGTLLDDLEKAPQEDEVDRDDALATAQEILNRRPAGASRVLYLTSDAGEGKTTLINQIAHMQAAAYKRKEVDWLLVPITLGGRPFIRLDDVVIAALVNRLRFQFLYYEAFLELVRMGVLVPALDGFEEMFVEGSSGEAVSALGNLLKALQSSGTVLISARKAYFEYKSFDTQARLFDSVSPSVASYARIALQRWSSAKFLSYCTKRGVRNGQEIYDAVTEVLTPGHPLVSRPVLVKRLLDVATAVSGRENLVRVLRADPSEYFGRFVRAIIEREVEQKWIDRSGEPARPLLTLDQHEDILAAIATEMWNSSTSALSPDVLDVVTDIFCEDRRMPVQVTRQVKERVKQHALIVSPDGRGQRFAFDHEEFWHYFLGKGVAQCVSTDDVAEMRQILRSAPLPGLSADVAAHELSSTASTVKETAGRLQEACETEGAASYLKENCGALLVRFLDGKDAGGTHIHDVTFPAESLQGRQLENARFRACYFEPSLLQGTRIVRCAFEECTFERLELSSEAVIEEAQLTKCAVRCVVPPESDRQIFEPAQIDSMLSRSGFSVVSVAPVSGALAPEEADEELVQAERAIRSFMRATQINENVFRQRLGQRGQYFMEEVLPVLLEAGIMREVPYLGAGRQRRFRLNVPMRRIDEALLGSGGRFDLFVKLVSCE
jgi:hypothetical protein